MTTTNEDSTNKKANPKRQRYEKKTGPESKQNGSNGAEPDLDQMDQEELTQFERHIRCFPEPMAAEAFQGIAGDVVRAIEARNEPCREALLAQFLVGFGNMLGRGTCCKQAGRHHLNEFMVLVGDTAMGRKGTAWRAILNLLECVDHPWSDRIRNGFQSGESIIHAVRDPRTHYTKPKSVLGTVRKTEIPGVSDKRLLILEEEFARLLMVASRQGNIISTVARNAWDGAARLFVEGKLAPETATGAHISMIGHITIFELLDLLRKVENQNGFTNRMLFIASRRWQEVAQPQWINWKNYYPEIVNRLQCLVAKYNTDAGSFIEWSEAGGKAWDVAYRAMGKVKGGGIVGPIIARADAHVLRLTMIYAILEDSLLMEPHHLKAALAFWDYAKRSAQWTFGENTGNRQADKLYWALRHEPNGLTRDQVTKEVFSNNASKNDIDMAVSELYHAKLLTVKHRWSEYDNTGHRKPVKWYVLLNGSVK